MPSHHYWKRTDGDRSGSGSSTGNSSSSGSSSSNDSWDSDGSSTAATAGAIQTIPPRPSLTQYPSAHGHQVATATTTSWYFHHRHRSTSIGLILALVAATFHQALISTPLTMQTTHTASLGSAHPERNDHGDFTSDRGATIKPKKPLSPNQKESGRTTVATTRASSTKKRTTKRKRTPKAKETSSTSSLATTTKQTKTRSPKYHKQEPKRDKLLHNKETVLAVVVANATATPKESSPVVAPSRAPTTTLAPATNAPTSAPIASAAATLAPIDTLQLVTTNYTETNLFDEPDYTRYATLADFLEGSGIDSEIENNNSALTLTHAAVCEFRPVLYSHHFPHVMQQLYRCVSWWLAHLDNQKLPAVLLIPARNVSWAADTSFIQGFVQLLQQSINLTVVYKDDVDTSGKNDVGVAAAAAAMAVSSKDTGKWGPWDTEITDFAMLDPNRLLRTFGLQLVHRDESTHSVIVTNTSAKCLEATSLAETRAIDDMVAPRISILNRPEWSSRHLKNAVAIQEMIETKFSFNVTVPIVEFTYETTFAQQAAVFLDTDILISPHGAQLIGLAFMPRCASILEVFPYRYQTAEYFGTLAASLDLHHGFVYIGDPNEEIPYADRFHFIRHENYKKDDAVEPDLARISEAVDIMLAHWKACVCSDQNDISAASSAAVVVPPTDTDKPPLTTSDYIETNLATAPDYTHYTQLSTFLEGPGLELDPNLVTEAICEFRPVRYSHHFPHVMQQFYRCFSWWLAHPDKPAVLVTGVNVSYDADTSFIKGFLGLLQSAINLTVVDVYESNSYDNDSIVPNMTVQSKDTGKWGPWDTEITDYAILDPHHQLHRYAKEHIPNESNFHPYQPSVDWSQSYACQPELSKQDGDSIPFQPRISILNRPDWSSRHLKNADEIKAAIEAKLPNQTVPVVTFTYYTTFEQQATLFYDTDILISPHGAQLTGLALLPRCASVFEIFPYRYLVAEYFGTLAASLNLHHGFVYVGDAAEEIPFGERFHFMRQDGNLKDAALEPNMTKISDALDGIIETWKQCVCSTGTTPSIVR